MAKDFHVGKSTAAVSYNSSAERRNVEQGADDAPAKGESWKDVAQVMSSGKVPQQTKDTTQRMIARMDEISPLCEAVGILDNGCGGGAVISYILDAYGQQLPSDTVIIAGDFSEHMVNAVRNKQNGRIEEGHDIWKRLQPRQLDAHELSTKLSPNSLSHVVASHVYFLLENSQKALQETHTVLRSGGILASSTGCGSQHIDAMEQALESVRPGTNLKMIREDWATEDAVQAQFRDSGFEDIETFVVDSEMSFQNHEDFARMLMIMPVMRNAQEGWTDDEKEAVVQKVMQIIQKMEPNAPGKLKGRNIVAIGRKA